MALKANTVPTALPSFTDFTQAAGIAPPSAPGAQTLPGGGDATGANMGSLIQQLQPTPVTAGQYTQGAMAMVPRIHPPDIRPNQDTNRMPLTNQLHDLKIARQHNRFASIANAVNEVTNAVQQKKFENLKTDLTNVSRAQDQVAKAEAAMKSVENTLKPDSGASPEARKAAQDTYDNAKGVLTKSKEYIETTLKDDKKRKEFSKAYDISFTDPEKNNNPYVKAGQAATKEAQKNMNSEVDFNTPEEKKLHDDLKAPAQQAAQSGAPQPAAVAQGQRSNTPYADQFLKAAPTQLMDNPQYAQQVTAATKQQDIILQHILPRILQNQYGLERQKLADDTSYRNAYLNAQQRYQSGLNAIQGAKDIAGTKYEAMAKMHDKDLANRYAIASLHTAATLGLWDNPQIMKLAPGGKQELLGKAAIANLKELDTSINASAEQVSRLETALYQLTHDKGVDISGNKTFTDEMRQRAQALQVSIEKEHFFQRNMRDKRDEVNNKLYGTPSYGAMGNTPGASTYGQSLDSASGFGSTGSPTVPNNDSANTDDEVPYTTAPIDTTPQVLSFPI